MTVLVGRKVPKHVVMCRDENCFHRGMNHAVWESKDFGRVIIHGASHGA
jgi:hypothetical protein